jgi:hypothetical protein
MSRQDQLMRGFRDGFAETRYDRLAHKAGIVVGVFVGVAVFSWLMWG